MNRYMRYTTPVHFHYKNGEDLFVDESTGHVPFEGDIIWFDGKEYVIERVYHSYEHDGDFTGLTCHAQIGEGRAATGR